MRPKKVRTHLLRDPKTFGDRSFTRRVSSRERRASSTTRQQAGANAHGRWIARKRLVGEGIDDVEGDSRFHGQKVQRRGWPWGGVRMMSAKSTAADPDGR
jgi:hypothetical protein